MTTVRLPPELELRLENMAKIRHKSKSDIIKDALEMLFNSEESEIDSYSAGKDVFGKNGSGIGTLSVTYKTKIKDKINAKSNIGR